MPSADLPLLAVTVGDPAGIGPGIVLKALGYSELYERCHPLIVRDRRMLERAENGVGYPPHSYCPIELPATGTYEPGTVTLLDLGNATPGACPPGHVSAAAGRAAVEHVFGACDLANTGHVDAIVTAPLGRAAMNLGGYAYAGHTELPAQRTGADRLSVRTRIGDHPGGCLNRGLFGSPAGPTYRQGKRVSAHRSSHADRSARNVTRH